jgi:hypothetical protein
VARTKRSRKLEQRRWRDAEREIAKRRAAGETVVVLVDPSSKTRPGEVAVGEPVDPDSSFAQRLARARAMLGPRSGRS